MSRAHEITIHDEAVGAVHFRVQIDPDKGLVSCWNLESGDGGTIHVTRLHFECCKATAAAEKQETTR